MEESRLVDIEIKGLAVCHYDLAEKKWNIEFICDKKQSDAGTHKLNYTNLNAQPKIIEESLINYDELEIETDNFIEFQSHIHQPLIKPFNMCHPNVHSSGIYRKKEIESGIKLIRLTIPHGQLSVSGKHYEFLVSEVINDGTPGGVSTGKPPNNIGFIGKTLTVTLKFSKDGKLMLKGKSGNIWEQIDKIELPSPSKYEIVMNNDCGICTGEESDFFMYYTCFRDKIDANKGFRVKPKQLILADKDILGIVNCYPVISDPPPTEQP